ncbi:MAG: CHAT domain-containing protein [Ignavibacteriales bacterium]|nr:CHAT domain-containing protein [Ignavibacteriales bacterium]
MKNKTQITYIFLIILLILPSQIKSQTWKEFLDKANLYNKQGNFDSAKILFHQALDSAQLTFGEYDSSVVLILRAIGVYFQNKHTDSAEIYYRRSIEVYTKSNNTSRLECAKAYHNLGVLLGESPRSDEAEKYFLQSLEIKRKLLLPTDLSILRTEEALGTLYRESGDFGKAVMMVKTVLERKEKIVGQNHSSLAITLNNLGIAYYYMGDYPNAEINFKRAISLTGEDTVGQAGFMNNLAAVYHGEKRYAEETEILKSAWETIKHRTNVNPSMKMLLVGDLGAAEYKSDKIEAGKGHLQEALTIARENGLDESLNITYSMRTLAEIYRDEKKYAEADSFYRATITIIQTKLSRQHQLLATTLQSHASLFRRMNILDSALTIYYKAFWLYHQMFRDVAQFVPEQEALRTALLSERSSNLYLSSYSEVRNPSEQHTAEAADIFLNSKGKISDEIFRRYQMFVRDDSPVIDSLARTYRAAKVRVASQYIQSERLHAGTGSVSVLDSLSRMVKRLESEMVGISGSFKDALDQGNITAGKIASCLPPSTVLIEFVKHSFFDWKTESDHPKYSALILSKPGQPARVVNLGDAMVIDDLVNSYREHMLAASSTGVTPAKWEEYQSIAIAIYKRVWQPLKLKLKAGTTIIVAPDGALNLISFSGLMKPSGKYLIEENPIHYLSSGRDLLRLQQSEKSGKGLLALGDVDFDATVEARIIDQQPMLVSNVEQRQMNMVRNARSDCFMLNKDPFQSLPGTRSEIEAVGSKWRKQNQNEPISIYYGLGASEEHFKQHASGKRSIHLATHGYFINANCTNQSGVSKEKQEVMLENPLLQSGLLLAGANLNGVGADLPGAEDGILTALEVSSLDLRGTDLVVLSACETGLGKVEQGEGVYGLRRAFQLAGAKTVVSSLWRIPDRETTTFMKILYSQNAKTYPELFQKAALQRLNELRIRKQSTHPYSWAGFIATGDWKIR